MTSPPDLPAGLLKATRDRWAAFWRSPAALAVDLDADMSRLLRWIQATDEYDRAARVVRKARVVRGSTGQPVLNPLAAYMAQLEAMITRTEKEFGMMPMSRARLDLRRPSVDEEIADLFASAPVRYGAAGQAAVVDAPLT